jgi:hypothetical protein
MIEANEQLLLQKSSEIAGLRAENERLARALAAAPTGLEERKVKAIEQIAKAFHTYLESK